MTMDQGMGAPFAPQSSAPPPAAPHYAQLHPSFQHNTFLIRRKVFSFPAAKLHVYSNDGNLLLFIKMKAFKLKEDITIYADESMGTPLLRIRARSIMDIGTAYDVYDVTTGGEYHVGVLKRKGMKSIIRDEWEIWNTQDQPIGKIQEDSGALAIFRRLNDLIAMMIPQKYNFSIRETPVGTMKQNFNPFVMKMTADFSADGNGYLDRRLAAAAASLLCVIEGKQG